MVERDFLRLVSLCPSRLVTSFDTAIVDYQTRKGHKIFVTDSISFTDSFFLPPPPPSVHLLSPSPSCSLHPLLFPHYLTPTLSLSPSLSLSHQSIPQYTWMCALTKPRLPLKQSKFPRIMRYKRTVAYNSSIKK